MKRWTTEDPSPTGKSADYHVARYYSRMMKNSLHSPSDKSDGSFFHKTQRVYLLEGVDFQSMPTFSEASYCEVTRTHGNVVCSYFSLLSASANFL